MERTEAQRLLKAFHRLMARYDPPLDERIGACGSDAEHFEGTPPRAGAEVVQRFAIAPDPQYPRIDNTTVAETGAEKQQIEATLKQYYGEIAAFQAAHGGRDQVPVFINGDIVEQGDQSTLDVAYRLIREHLGDQAFMGLGNHDCDLKGDLVFDETRMVRSCFRHVEYMKKAGVAMDLWESGGGDPFWQMYEGSLAYAVDIGDIRFIQLNYYPSFTRNLKAHLVEQAETKEFKLYSSMQWLEDRLKEVASTGKVIVIHAHIVHIGQELDAFFSLCEKYEVPAVFRGHTHGLSAETHRGTRIVECGAGFFRTFAVAEYQKENSHLAVYFVRNGVVDRSRDVGTNVWRDMPLPSVGTILRFDSGCSLELVGGPWSLAEFTEAEWMVDGQVRAPQRYRANEVIRLLGHGPDRTLRVRVRYINFRGRSGAWTAWSEVPAYEGTLPGVPTGVRVEVNGHGFSDCTVRWDAVDGGHGYVVKVARGTDSLGGNVLTSLPPNCHERTDVSMAALKSPPSSYRGMYIKVMTTTHDNLWSRPALLPIDDLLDELERVDPVQRAEEREAELGQLVAERDQCLQRLVDIELRLDALSG